VVGDESGVVERQYVDVPDGGGLAGGGNAVEGAVVGSAHDADADDGVGFGDDPLELEGHVRAPFPQSAEDASGAFGTGGCPGPRVVVDEARREERLAQPKIVRVE
jgi:hypothetical protein